MAWRYRRRLRLARRLYLKFGKTGVTGVSLGGRGAHVTLGRRGKRATIGFPGSGLSYTAYEPYHHRSTELGEARRASLAPAVIILVILGLIVLGAFDGH
jgi:hypothetical protein